MNDHNRPVTGYPATHPPPNGYSGTAYPYAAAPPPSTAAYYYNQQQQLPPPYTTQRATFLRRVISIAIAAMVITGTFIFIIWLILRPKLPEFRVDSLSIANLNLTTNNPSSISANWDLHFTVRNPNKKMTLYYDDIAAAVYYDDVLLADNTLPPFDQDKRAETPQKATFTSSGAYVEKKAVDGMNYERGKSASIVFNVRMVSRVRFKAGAWRARRRYIRVYCKGLSVGVASGKSSGNLLGGPRQCRVGF